MANATAAKGPSKSEILVRVAEQSQLSRKQVATVFDALSNEIKNALGRKGPGIFVVPGLMKLTIKNKPATKARKGRNPFTGEEIMIKAKPASRKVRARALRSLNALI